MERPAWLKRRVEAENQLWTDCRGLASTAVYKPLSIGGPFDDPDVYTRSVEWRRAPYDYRLQELARTNTVQGHTQRTGNAAAMFSTIFRLDRLGLEPTDTGDYTFDFYFLARNGLAAAMHAAGNGDSERDQAVVAALNFTYGNGLYAPNVDDKIVFSEALKSGYLDGVRPVTTDD